MANKAKNASRNSKKEKGQFCKKRLVKTAYQLEREQAEARRKRNGNYAIDF